MKNHPTKFGIISIIIIQAVVFIHTTILLGDSDKKIKRSNSAYLENSSNIIAIDIGHSKINAGAISSRGIGEYYFNLILGKRLLHDLFEKGYTKSFIINPQGDDISLKNRVNIANNKNANLFISIHHDSVQPKYLKLWQFGNQSNHYCDLFSGYSIFYSTKNISSKKSLLFANALGYELNKNKFVPTLHHSEKIDGESRELVNKSLGIYRVDDLGVIKSSKMPAIILECGVIVNRNEELLLSNPVYQEKISTAVVRSIDGFFRK